MPRTATLRPLTEAVLSQLHIARDARIEALESVAGEDPDAGCSHEFMSMLRRLDSTHRGASGAYGPGGGRCLRPRDVHRSATPRLWCRALDGRVLNTRSSERDGEPLRRGDYVDDRPRGCDLPSLWGVAERGVSHSLGSITTAPSRPSTRRITRS
jgi:hypothetical protein